MSDFSAQLLPMPPVTSMNPLYHEWGLFAALLGLCLPLVGVAIALHRAGMHDVKRAILKIRSDLASLFQKTVIQESKRILSRADDQLPSILSSIDRTTSLPSAFDRLCLGLKKIDPKDPDKDEYRHLMESALSGVISGATRQLLCDAEEAAERQLKNVKLEVSFEGRTQQDLTFIAGKTAELNKKVKILFRSRLTSRYLLLASGAAGLLAVPTLFLASLSAYYLGVTLLICFALLGAGGLIEFALFGSCKSWLVDTKDRYKGPQDWYEELANYRTD